MTTHKNKIGLLTKSRVYNYGSALQTYATIKAIQNLGHDVELIDYDFPSRFTYGWKTAIKNIIKTPLGLSDAQKPKKFHRFWKEYYPTSVSYSREDLLLNPPSYDVYMVGSDQVWNPSHGDTTFLLDFLSDRPCYRVSYASSIGVNNLPKSYAKTFRDNLSLFNRVSVREESDVKTVKKYADVDAKCVCDPTLLLTKSEWQQLKSVNGNKRIVEGRYILAYILDYSYNPYPFAKDMIDRISKELNLPVVFLDAKMGQLKYGYKIVNNCGPIDFLNLISNASFLITTSFHGTAFAANLGVPFCSIVKSLGYSDSRMVSLLTKINAENQIVECNKMPDVNSLLCFDRDGIKARIENFRSESIDFLSNKLNSAK